MIEARGMISWDGGAATEKLQGSQCSAVQVAGVVAGPRRGSMARWPARGTLRVPRLPGCRQKRGEEGW